MTENIEKTTKEGVNKEFCEKLEQLKSRAGGVEAFIFLVVDEKKKEDGSQSASCYAAGPLSALGALYANATAPNIKMAASLYMLKDIKKFIEKGTDNGHGNA